MKLSHADEVWNRAAMESGGANPLPGDQALAALLAVHGMVMNGGVGHVFDTLEAEERLAGVAGFRFFAFDAVALLLERAEGLGEEERRGLDSEYAALIPSDGALDVAFKRLFSHSPNLFAPPGHGT
ncbi:MAG: hypothetical protein AB7G12_09615 [Thermoanaerobaculia bacterium]